MKNVNVYIFLGGIALIILAFIVEVAALGYIGLIIGLIGFIWFFVEANVEAKQRDEDFKNSLNDKARIADKEKTEYLTWLHSNYNVTKTIGVGSGLSWNVNRVCAIDENKEVILFGKKEIPFEKILQVELKTATSQYTTTESQKNNPVGRAVVGGIVAGEVGAIVGATTSKETSTSRTVVNTRTDGIIIYLSDISEPVFRYQFVNDEENREIYAILLAIISSNSAKTKI